MNRPNPFREAKQYLRTRQEVETYWHKPQAPRTVTTKEFCICFALSKALGFNRIDGGDFIRARNYVMKKVGRHSMASDWLRAWLKRKGSTYVPNQAEYQDYRHQWLDHMAKLWDEGKIK